MKNNLVDSYYINEPGRGQYSPDLRKGDPHGRGMPYEVGEDYSLSKAHIRPRTEKRPSIQWVEGASLLRTTKARECAAVGGGKRGKVKGFSRASRRRLLELIASIKREAEYPDFMTLTYPNEFPTVDRAKRDLKVFIQRLERAFPKAGYIWKLEPQERGAPHYHLLLWGCDTHELLKWTVNNWYDIAGNGDKNHYNFHAGLLKGSKPCVEKVRSFRGVWAYAAKYLGKEFEVSNWGNTWTGRYWGVGQRHNIPFGQVLEEELPLRQVICIMRYQRRHMRKYKEKKGKIIKKEQRGRDNNSLKTFCDATQWVEKLIRSGQGRAIASERSEYTLDGVSEA